MTEGLIKSGDVQGLHVVGFDGSKLGSVRELFVQLDTGQVQFIIIEAASLLGGSGKFHPVPWAAVRYDAVGHGFQIETNKDDFKSSPSYDREQLANPNYGWDEQAVRYFTTPQSE
jgi:sporulation protein YlmC with PRC-barrel domain